MNYFTLKICGLSRQLPLIFVGKNTRFASFNLLGDALLVTKVAKKLTLTLEKTDFDVLVGPEVKVVPLICELARLFKHERFVICRKSVKPYMVSPVILKPLPHFPKHVRQLVLDGIDANFLKNKKVVVVDDVVSTGVTMRMMGKLMEKVGAKVVAFCAVLKEGEQFDKFENLITLGKLPIDKRPETP